MLKESRKVVIGLLFIILQIVIFRHLEFYRMQPDVVIVFLLWVAVTSTRLSSVIITAIISFTQDALLDLWGVHMFSKTLTIFMVYNLIPRAEPKRMSITQIFFTILLLALLNNIIFLGVNSFIDAYNAGIFFGRVWIGNSIYTALMGIFIYMFYSD